MGRLHLVSAELDRELDAIRQTLATFHAVAGIEDVITVLQRAEHTELVDLIGHSSSGFLVLGSWTINDSPQTAASFSQLVRPLLEARGVRTIRLLGCSTAATERGRCALRRIARATRCDVLGTRRYITRRDYVATGFAREDSLVRA